MPDYRRSWCPGGTYFFTLAMLRRRHTRLLVDHVDLLRWAVGHVRKKHPFRIHAWVTLPDHLHCLIELPPDETDFALRWRLIKACFSRHLEPGEPRSTSRASRGERGIWQRRYWEHLIRDEDDYRAHADYIHYNPVKHGHTANVAEWPHSTFHRWVERGLYPRDWGGGGGIELPHDE